MNAMAELVTYQNSMMELASMSSLDIEDAKDELYKRGIKEPTFDMCFDMLSSMRSAFAAIFMDELRKMK